MTRCQLSGRFLSFWFPFHLSTEANSHSWVLGMQTGDQLLQLLQQLHGDARSKVECLYLSLAWINLFLFFHINNIEYYISALIFMYIFDPYIFLVIFSLYKYIFLIYS